MKIAKTIFLLLAGTTAQADDNAAWMCLFENVPVAITEPASMIGEKKLKVSVSNGLGFAVSKVAVDFSLASDDGETRFEQNIVFPFPAHLQPDETRDLVAYLTMPDETAAGLDHSDLTARAATANVLDDSDKRIVLRENMGPSFQVFWPFQPKSDHICD